MSQKLCFLAGLAATLVLACSMPALGGRPPVLSYQILPLDLGTYARSIANDISDPSESEIPRQVVGYVAEEDTPDVGHPACWTTSVVGGAVQSALHVLSLPTIYGEGMACGINADGQIVGAGSDGDQHVGLYWSQFGAQPEVLAPLPGDSGSYAYAINKDGVICGCSVNQSGYWPVLWWVIETGIVGPVELPASEYAAAVAINDNRAGNCVDVVGMSSPDAGVSGGYSAVAWTAQLQVVDGTLKVTALVAVLDENGHTQGVNNAGTVCGSSETSNPLLQAVVWTGGVERALKGAKFYITRSATAINDQGVIVGTAEYTRIGGSYRAVMWVSATESMVLLNQFLEDNSPLLTLTWTEAVNNFGEIVGFGYAAGGLPRAFLAIPK